MLFSEKCIIRIATDVRARFFGRSVESAIGKSILLTLKKIRIRIRKTRHSKLPGIFCYVYPHSILDICFFVRKKYFTFGIGEFISTLNGLCTHAINFVTLQFPQILNIFLVSINFYLFFMGETSLDFCKEYFDALDDLKLFK
jgi:hypothetical protein